MHMGIKLLALIFLPLLVIVVIRGGLNYSGFCWEEKRWLSDEEFLLAIARFAEDGKYLQNIKQHKGEITEEDIRQFLKYNPDCCRFKRSTVGMESSMGWLNRITGSMYVAGELAYRVPDERIVYGQYNTFDYYWREVTVSNCGKSNNEFSQPFTKKENEFWYGLYLQNK